ncbi:uncharacterized protein LOC128892496 [Hylaeus anthracinus]|uniref:uncharacterized protein LOC128892496 n=1 Tax=Hylaeus anthracinus TaxID=313031 RepID=UPI0023B9A74A|nr:uncharacterized protein LOC128892496 [Hylaeus anthracinus]
MEELLEMESRLWDQADRLTSQKEYLAWEERCNECLESLEEHSRAKRPRLSIGVQQSLIARIARLDSLKYSLRRRFVYEGAGHSSTGLFRREIDTAFESRVLTSAVLNSHYIEPRNFLQVARDVVLEHIRKYFCNRYVYNNSFSFSKYVMFEKKFMSFYCRCLHYFSSSEKLEAHTVDCEKMNECAIVLPDDESKWLSFDNYIRKERFVVYADLECILEKTDREAPRSTYQHHKVFNIAYYVQCAYDSSLSVYQCHRDANCVSWFVKELKNLAHFVKLILSNNIQMDDITSEQQEAFRNATHCHICEKPFGENDTRVRDHCHLTGRYRGPAHSNHIDMVLFIECGIRGGLSQCSGRYAKANNKYMQSYDPSTASSYLMYFDVNNLYGWAMCQPLPYAEFRWVDNVANFDVSSIAADSPTGYILEVDLEYPQRLHDIHADLPFCPTRAKPPGKREDKLLLDISKVCLYEFHHDYMLPTHDDKCKVMYTDTDSLIYHIECENIYDTIKRDINRFDTSDYPVGNVYDIPLVNKEVPGLMKDENNGAIMTEFVGLRAKMYALRVDGKKDTKKAKGVVFECMTELLDD